MAVLESANVEELIAHLGVPPKRIRLQPPPGQATEDDVIVARPLCELIDGVLVEKAMGFWESRLAVLLGYYIGDVLAKMEATPELITAADFRLRADSAGYRAGKDGKDLGANVDLVGPGPAYERWKKTPEYQQWLKETKQVTKAKTPTVEPKAFVLLGGKGVAERKFDTLAEAVLSASTGDTIEVRGNGPFISEPVSLGDVALVIRAADGFRPVLKLTTEAIEKGRPLLETSAALVLEGLELHQVSQTIRGGGSYGMLISHEAPLWLANCRFFMKDQGEMCVRANYCPTVELHNCEFFTNGQGLLLLVDKSSKCLVSNCVQAGGNTLGVNSFRPGRWQLPVQYLPYRGSHGGRGGGRFRRRRQTRPGRNR